VTGGTEWVVDALDCDPDRLRDPVRLRALCDGIVTALSLTVIDEPHLHVFPGPGGITALYLLAESHLACHTFPETGLASFNLYCCKPREITRSPDGSRNPVEWAALLADALGARNVKVTVVPRGVAT
jgi:S-adenosylmethionine decarboxylase